MTAVVSLGKTLNLMPVCEWNENAQTHMRSVEMDKRLKGKEQSLRVERCEDDEAVMTLFQSVTRPERYATLRPCIDRRRGPNAAYSGLAKSLVQLRTSVSLSARR